MARRLMIPAVPVNGEINTINEGKARCMLPGNVFYNPVQEHNRDLSILFLNCLSCEDKLRILEPLAASGLRSIRYALEIPKLSEIVANDGDKLASETMLLNVKHNKADDRVKVQCMEANSLMYSNKDGFDVVDIDPYGSPAPFLDAAVQSVRDNGILMITATDAAVLCGHSPDSCYTKYGTLSLRNPACHELGLRTLLHAIYMHCAHYNRYIEPLISVSVDFYFRLFVRVKKGQMRAKQQVANFSFLYGCHGCTSFFLQPLGTSSPRGSDVAFVSGPPLGFTNCQFCQSKLHLGGPVWTGPLHNKQLVENMLLQLDIPPFNTYKSKEKIKGLLSVILEELDTPLYVVLDDLCKKVNVITPKIKLFRSALLNSGYKVSSTHCNRNGVKTDAPMSFIWDVIRQWAKSSDLGGKSRSELGKLILSVDPQSEVDFTMRSDALSTSQQLGIRRFPLNPPNWGPAKRARRKSGSSEDYEKSLHSSSDNEKNPSSTGDFKRKLNSAVDNVHTSEAPANSDQ